MVEIPIPVRVDLDRGIKKTYLDTVFATEDDKAHRFDVALYRGNEPVTLPSGASVSAYFIRYSDNGTLPLTGEASGNVVSVTLSKACYNKCGAFALIIKVLEGGVTNTVFYGEGSMFISRTDTLIDTENVIPSLEELLAMVTVMENATADATTATGNAVKAAQDANAAAQRANTEADAAKSWAEATATVETLEAGEDADVNLSTAAGGAKLLEFYIPRGESGVYIGTKEPTDPTVQVWIDPDGEADELPSGVTPEEIQAAVDSYLTENPVTSGATAAQAAQIQKNKEDIAELKQNGTGGSGSDGNDGEDGFSPTVQVAEITGGHSVSITDAVGTKTFNVMDGKDGKDGATGATGPAGAKGETGAKGEKGDKGDTGPAGADYVLTDADKQEIASMIEVPKDGGTSGTWDIIADVTVEDNSVAYYKFDVPDGKMEFVVLLTFMQDSEITSAVNGKMCVNSTNGPWGGDGCTVAYNLQSLAYKETDLSMTYLWRFDFIGGYIVPKTRFMSMNSAASRNVLVGNAAVSGGFELHKASDSNEVMLQQCDKIRTIEIGSYTKWFGRGSRLLIMAR